MRGVLRFAQDDTRILRLTRIPVVEPGLCCIGVSAALPEPSAIAIEELDLPNPLRALPRVELRRDHATGSAMLSRQRLPFPRVNEEHVVLDRSRQRQVR